MIANNQTAKTYDTLQNSIDWNSASNDAQLQVLSVMKQLLIECRSYTPIFDNDVHPGMREIPKYYISADDMYKRVTRRISRLTSV